MLMLDLAAGTGDQSLLAARKVGPAGMVLATDLSGEMLMVAAQRAELEGLTTIMTCVMDAEQLNLEERSFDAVICRNGLMLSPHLQSTLRGIHRVLKPGGKLAALVWKRNPFHMLPLTILANYGGQASADLPNPFTLSDPAVFEQALSQFEGPEGLVAQGETLLGVGTNPE